MAWEEISLLFAPSTNSILNPRSGNHNGQQGKDRSLLQFPHGLKDLASPAACLGFLILSTRSCIHVREEKEGWWGLPLEESKRKEEETPHLCMLSLFSSRDSPVGS